MRLTAIDEAIVHYSPDAVRRVLLDVSAYPVWWRPAFQVEDAPHVSTDPTGTTLRISAGPLQRWTAKVATVEPERIAFEYGGAWRGTARWDIHPALEGTRLVHRVDLEPVPFWLKVWAMVRPLDRHHSKRVARLFTALSKRLEALGEPRCPDPVPEPENTPRIPRH
jgi:hypothetical protein